MDRRIGRRIEHRWRKKALRNVGEVCEIMSVILKPFYMIYNSR